jgi:hypothetical protein
MNLARLALAASVLSAAACTHAIAQETDRTGVSHPDESGIVATPDPPATPPGQPAQPDPTVYGPYRPYTGASNPATAPILRASSEPAVAPTHLTAPMDIDAGIVTRVPGPSNALPEGTLIKIRLNQSLSTLGTALGTPFDGELTEPIERDGHVLLPAGSLLSGRVTEVHGGRRISGAATLHLQTLAVTLPDGTHYPIHAQVIDTNLFRTTKVDREGNIVRKDHVKETAAELGLSTGAGIATGALVAGPAGAVVGGVIGAGVGTTVWLKQDRQATLPTDTLITFSLDIPLVVGGQ